MYCKDGIKFRALVIISKRIENGEKLTASLDAISYDHWKACPECHETEHTPAIAALVCDEADRIDAETIGHKLVP